MDNKFCNFLNHQVRIEYNRLTPCCWFKNMGTIVDRKSVDDFRDGLSKINSWESANGNCDECKNREAKGLYSPRLESLNHWLFENVDNDYDIMNIEIQIDNDCNAACLICGPWNSSTWEKYQARADSIPIASIPRQKSNLISQIKTIKDSIDFSKFKQIRFLGGEPLRTDSHLKFLEDIKHPEDKCVIYTSNGSYKPNAETLEIWSRFKSIQLEFSIDAIGEQFNYLRWPLQWNQVVDNFKFLLDRKNSNIEIGAFSYTTTPLSLFYHDRYEQWAREFFKGTSVNVERLFHNPWQPRGNIPMLLTAVPPKLNQAISDKYGPDHNITKLLEPYSNDKHKKFLNYLAYHDSLRKTNWKEAFPEMVQYF